MTFNLEPKFLPSQCYASNRKVIESYALSVPMNLSSLFALLTKMHKSKFQGGVILDGPKICLLFKTVHVQFCLSTLISKDRQVLILFCDPDFGAVYFHYRKFLIENFVKRIF